MNREGESGTLTSSLWGGKRRVEGRGDAREGWPYLVVGAVEVQGRLPLVHHSHAGCHLGHACPDSLDGVVRERGSHHLLRWERRQQQQRSR